MLEAEPNWRVRQLFRLLLAYGLVTFALAATAAVVNPTAPRTARATLLVPADHPTIQDAVNAAVDGDTILVSPGTYGSVAIDGKNLTLASEFHATGEPSAISETVIDGADGGAALAISDTDATTSIIGFTIQNADDGVLTRNAHFQFLNNVVRLTKDGIDYESSRGGTSGGVVRDSIFEDNTDDGIDLDDAVEVVIEDSIVRNNGNDGIEIRLHPHTGPTLDVVVRRNELHGNDNDGIQLIGYPARSDRNFVIEQNLIHDNGDAGIGLMDNAETDEDFRGAPLSDPIRVANNTFDNNAWAHTGGANTTFVNNAVLNSVAGGLKNLTGTSSVSYSGFWQNTLDTDNVNLGPGLVFADPRMSSDYTLTSTSPYVDAGDPTCSAANDTICDIGRFEFEPAAAAPGDAPVPADRSASADEGAAAVVGVPGP